MNYKFLYVNLLLVLLILDCNGQTDCLNEIKKNDWNLSICIDENTSVDMTNKDVILIKERKTQKKKDLIRTLSISTGVNSNNLPINDLLDKYIGSKLGSEKHKIISDTLYSNGGNQYFIRVASIENNSNTAIFLSGIIKYKTQFYIISSLEDRDEKDSTLFFYRIIEGLTFFGEPRMRDSKLIEKEFLDLLSNSLNSKKEFSKLLIDFDTLNEVASIEEKNDINQIKEIIPNWNLSAYRLIEKFNLCRESVLINEGYFKRDESKSRITNILSELTVYCESLGNVTIRFTGFEIKDKIYIARVIIEE